MNISSISTPVAVVNPSVVSALSGVATDAALINALDSSSVDSVGDASSIVYLSSLGQLLSSMTSLQSLQAASGAASTGNGQGVEGETTLGDVVNNAQLLVDGMNNFQSADVDYLENPFGSVLSDGLLTAMNVPLTSNSDETLLAGLQNIGIDAQSDTALLDPGQFTVNLTTLQAAFAANPTETESVLSQAFNVVSQFAASTLAQNASLNTDNVNSVLLGNTSTSPFELMAVTEELALLNPNTATTNAASMNIALSNLLTDQELTDATNATATATQTAAQQQALAAEAVSGTNAAASSAPAAIAATTPAAAAVVAATATKAVAATQGATVNRAGISTPSQSIVTDADEVRLTPDSTAVTTSVQPLAGATETGSTDTVVQNPASLATEAANNGSTVALPISTPGTSSGQTNVNANDEPVATASVAEVPEKSVDVPEANPAPVLTAVTATNAQIAAAAAGDTTSVNVTPEPAAALAVAPTQAPTQAQALADADTAAAESAAVHVAPANTLVAAPTPVVTTALAASATTSATVIVAASPAVAGAATTTETEEPAATAEIGLAMPLPATPTTSPLDPSLAAAVAAYRVADLGSRTVGSVPAAPAPPLPEPVSYVAEVAGFKPAAFDPDGENGSGRRNKDARNPQPVAEPEQVSDAFESSPPAHLVDLSV